MLLASFAGDDAAECCFLLMIFVIGSWFISIPILIIYICSVVQAIRHRDYTNKVFLGCHCFNVLQLLCFVIFLEFTYFFLNPIGNSLNQFSCHCCHSF